MDKWKIQHQSPLQQQQKHQLFLYSYLASSMEQNQTHIHLFRADAALAFVYKSI